MSATRSATERVERWSPVVLRLVAVTVTLYPALRKFLEYSARVQQFRGYGMPWPALSVPLTGVIEVLAIVSIGAGLAGRFGAGTLVVGMLVAIVAAGPNPFSVTVLLASTGIALRGTGPYTIWDPTPGDLLEGLASGADGPAPRGRGNRK